MGEQQVFCIQRRVVAHKTSESWESTPHVSILLELDVTDLLSFTRQIAHYPEFDGIRVTFNSMMLKIIATAIKHSPQMNAHIRYNKHSSVGSVTLEEDVNIATPMRSEDGRMLTPVLKQADKMTLREVCLGMEDVKRRVRNTDVDCLLLEAGLNDTWERLGSGQLRLVLRRLYANFIGPSRLKRPSRERKHAYRALSPADRITPADLLSGTTLVSNIGSAVPDIRAHFGLLEIIAPHTTALGLSAVRRQPMAVMDDTGQESIAIRDVLPISVCFDHRAMDFEHMAGFMRELNRLVTHPSEML